MQVKVDQMSVGVPDVLKQLIWDPKATTEAQPVNATEVALAPLIDAKYRVRSVNCVPKFLQVFQKAKTEADQALVLVVLRATATALDAKLSSTCTAAFEKCGGLKIAKKWLNEAVEWNYSDLLVLLLDVLKVLPVQLTSITEARINEPIVKLRKTAQEDKVKRAAQDLLKHWRGRFTEKEKEKTKSTTTSSSTPVASTDSALSSARPDIKVSSTSSPSLSSVTTAAKATEAAVKESKVQKQRRPIKWLDQPPGSASSSKSSELIGNLMQRKSAKDAAASKAAKDSSSDNKESSSGSSSKQVSSEGSSQKPPKEEVVLQLPTIQSFKAVATTSVSKKIRWADEEGKDLVKIKLIESWRDMIHHSPHDESSFNDAKLREHEAERLAMKSQKDRDSFQVVITHEWVTPALLQLPEALASRRGPVQTGEVEVQSARTRREMEFLVLDGEVPPVSPKEWTRTNEPHRGPPKEIPLLDVDAANSAVGSVPPVTAYGEPPETNEERALREALGPLQRSTIALLMDNEHVLPMVYEEAQRNGNRIPDGRVVEIVDYHRRQAPPHQFPPHHQPPPRGYNQQPPSSQGYDAGFNKYGGGGYNNGPPAPAGGPGAYDYNHQYGPPPGQSLKRKAPGGVLADAPAPKRLPMRGPPQCMYFLSPAGCKHGSNCQYAHDAPVGPGGPGGPPPPHMGGPVDYGNAYGPPPGGRFGGHQPPMGMRGGGGIRGMRGGR